jgi:hypothetical protein
MEMWKCGNVKMEDQLLNKDRNLEVSDTTGDD